MWVARLVSLHADDGGHGEKIALMPALAVPRFVEQVSADVEALQQRFGVGGFLAGHGEERVERFLPDPLGPRFRDLLHC